MAKTKACVILLIAASLLAVSFAGCASRDSIELQGATPLAATSAWEENPVWSPDGSKIFFQQHDLQDQEGYICVVNSDGSDMKRLTEGIDFVLSPDGSKILFYIIPQGYSGDFSDCLWLMESDGSNKKNLPPLHGPSFSPDGSGICYYESYATGFWWVKKEPGGSWTRVEHGPEWGEEEQFFCVVAEELADIWVMDVDGEGKTKIASDIPNGSGWLAWSPDGEKIFFQESYPTGFWWVKEEPGGSWMRVEHEPEWGEEEEFFCVVVEELADIWVIDVDGEGKTKIASDIPNGSGWLAWSPDGEKILYQTSELSNGIVNTDIWTMNVDGSDKTQVTDYLGDDLTPKWSPDGKKIAYRSGELLWDKECRWIGGCFDIWVVNSDGTERMKLTESIGFDKYFYWSPDGREIAYVFWIGILPGRDNDDKSEIWVMNADGSGRELLLSIPSKGGMRYTREIKWSPDGSKIAFVIDDFSGSPGDIDIYAIDVPAN